MFLIINITYIANLVFVYRTLQRKCFRSQLKSQISQCHYQNRQYYLSYSSFYLNLNKSTEDMLQNEDLRNRMNIEINETTEDESERPNKDNEEHASENDGKL